MIDVHEDAWAKEETINSHIPVMLDETLEFLNPHSGGVFVDGTLGLGGHAAAVLKKIGSTGKMVGLDKDLSALELAQKNLKEFGSQIIFHQEDFKNLKHVLTKNNIHYVNGILLDLGISSMQLDNPARGFGLKTDGPLDMRMDQRISVSAYDLINSLSEKEIAHILKEWGEERYFNRIARKLVQERAQKPIKTTGELRQIVMKAMPYDRSYTKIHPATRTFQAFRIAVNHELESIVEAFDQCLEVLVPGGRLVVISFHSLEDRLVKNKFRDWAKQGKVKLLTKKPVDPGDKELAENSRSRSAHLRAVERI